LSGDAQDIVARLERLPPSRQMWRWVMLLSLGGCFEFYDLMMTAYISPALVRAGVFHVGKAGLFGVSDQATFAAATFIGLFIGTIGVSRVADRFGRRAIFTASLLWYTAAAVIMATQSSAIGIDVWRLIAGVGIGVELVTIDTYVSELTPKHLRGRAFAFNQFITFLVVPVVAFLSYMLVPTAPLGLDGWRWVVLIGAVGAVLVWWIRLGIPESPRWLIQQGRLAEADRITTAIETAVAAEIGPLPPPAPLAEGTETPGRFLEIWQPPYRARTVLMSLYNLFQAIGYYGFASWVPTLIIAKGIHVTQSLEYAFIIAIANPVGPLLGMLVADRIERKWQIVMAAASVAVFGVLFSLPSSDILLILCGVMLTMANNWMSFAYHSYQAELFPTRVRARAVGFVYSWSRFSVIFSGFFITFFLNSSGVTGVFLFIAFCMMMVILLIGFFGPRTRNLALEEISH
jgi:MFS transporter, putative metabolite:H+ symporter